MLTPYALVANLRVIYQIVGYRVMSVVLSIAQLVVMVLFVWGFSLASPEHLWWGFPTSALVLLVIVLLGLRLVNGTNQNITYKYMYDQNMVYMTFQRN